MNIMYDRFYTYDEMTDALNNLKQTDVNGLLTIETFCISKMGCNIPIVIINNQKTGNHTDKPAYYIQANVHSNEGSGTTAALYFINYLLNEPLAEDILKHVAFYIVPRINVDGAEQAFTTGYAPRSRHEPNGLKNGIVPEDVNGDGKILWMRWKDPLGSYVELEEDRRILIKRKPEHKDSECYQMVQEGFIRDYDGSYICDGVRQIDYNRNYAVFWRPKANAMKYPFADAELRAVGDFTTARRNIFAGIDLHNGTAGILRIPGGDIAENDIDRNDLELTKKIGRMAERITGLPLISERDYVVKGYPPNILPGNSNEWAYRALGISFYVIELGMSVNSAGYTAEEVFATPYEEWEIKFDVPALKIYDEKGLYAFEEWKTFDHPQLGRVEIGGLSRGNSRYLNPYDMEPLAPKLTEFFIAHASLHPRLVIDDVETSVFSGNVYRIRCRVGNTGGLGTKIMSEGDYDSNAPVKIELIVPSGVDVISREKIIEKPAMKPGDVVCLEWFVTGGSDEVKNGAYISVIHPKTGKITASI